MAETTTWREQFEETPVRVTAPNEQVSVTLTGTSWVEVSFAPGYYQRADERQLAEQLTRVARLMYVERTRAFYDGLSRETGDIVRPGSGGVSTSRETREYHRRLEELSAEGSSADGSVRMFGTGLSHFLVSIAPGTLSRLSEEQFIAAGREAGLAFLADHLQKVRELKFDVYIRPELEAQGLVPQ
jgi:hypothetical protein